MTPPLRRRLARLVNSGGFVAPGSGQKISAIGSLGDIDRELLLMELDLAVKRGKIAADAPAEEKIQIMQRKANLGMNAVLSLSLALGRLVSARDGMELPEVLRGMEFTIDRDYLYGVKAGGIATERAAQPSGRGVLSS